MLIGEKSNEEQLQFHTFSPKMHTVRDISKKPFWGVHIPILCEAQGREGGGFSMLRTSFSTIFWKEIFANPECMFSPIFSYLPRL